VATIVSAKVKGPDVYQGQQQTVLSRVTMAVTEVQAKMLTAANVSWQAQDRIVVHYTESFSVSEASLQTPRQQAALTGFHNGAAAETKGPNRNGHVLADHGGDGLDEWTDPQFPAAGRLRGVRLRRVRGRVLQAV